MVFKWTEDHTPDPDSGDLVLHVEAVGKEFVVHITEEALEMASGSGSRAEGIKKCRQLAETKISRGMVSTSPCRKAVVSREDVSR